MVTSPRGAFTSCTAPARRVTLCLQRNTHNASQRGISFEFENVIDSGGGPRTLHVTLLCRCLSLLSHARLRCMCTCNRCTFCLCQNFLNSELLQTVRAKLYAVVLRRSFLIKYLSDCPPSSAQACLIHVSSYFNFFLRCFCLCIISSFVLCHVV